MKGFVDMVNLVMHGPVCFLYTAVFTWKQVPIFKPIFKVDF